MRLELDPSHVNKYMYISYCKFIFKLVKLEIANTIQPYQYKAREKDILKSNLITWDKNPPKHLDLVKYVKDCLELANENGTLVIRLNDTKIIPGSSTKVSTLIRLLEFGNETVRPYPFIRDILIKFERVYRESMLDYMRGGKR